MAAAVFISSIPNAKPWTMPMSCSAKKSRTFADAKFQVPIPSISIIPAMLPSAATPSATTTASRLTRITATSLATAMRARLGSRVKVTRPVRWLHSAVTARMPSTGSRMLCGVAVAPTKLRYVSWAGLRRTGTRR